MEVKTQRKCTVGGCDTPHYARGFCTKHYARFRSNGHTGTAVSDWATRTSHPLHKTWMAISRNKHHRNVCDRWLNDFWAFVEDVKVRPEGIKIELRRLDSSLPLDPNNFYWKEPTFSMRGVPTKERNRDWQRKMRAADPWFSAGQDLKRKYGITVDDYLAMHTAQEGKCAICRCEEKAKNSRSTGIKRLAVDHCHKTNTVRGLLCSPCNIAIGAMKENPDTLISAVAYLKKHSGTETVVPMKLVKES